MMRALLYTIMFLFGLSRTLAQPFNVDSLRNRIESAVPDTNKVKMLGQLSSYYNHNHLDSGVFYVRQMITLSQKIKFPYGEAWGLSILATSADRTGDMAKSLEFAISCLHAAEKLNYGRNDMLTRAYSQMGVVNFLTGHYPESRAYLRQALVYARLQFPNESFYYQIFAHIGNAFRRQGLVNSAAFYTQKGYDLSLTSKDRFFYPYVNNCQGERFEMQHLPEIARQYYSTAVFWGIRVNHLFQLSYSYSQLSNLFNHTGNLDSSIYFAKKSLQLSQLFFYGTFIPGAADHLATAFEKLHQPDSAVKYLRITMEVKDRVMNQTKQQQFILLDFEEQQRKEKEDLAHKEYTTRLRTTFLVTGIVILAILMILLYRNNLLKQRSNIQLLKRTKELQETMKNLRDTQSQLIQSEKMASLGELTAGIAHEIQNPLNFVNNFSEVNTELLQELETEQTKPSTERNAANELDIIHDLKSNLEKINHHGKRADAIVKGMLQHSRKSSGQKEPTDLNALCDEYLRLAYHGLRAKDKDFNADLKTSFDNSIGKINLVPQDIGRVMLNLFNNAFYAVKYKASASAKASTFAEASVDETSDRSADMSIYKPTVQVQTKKLGDKVEIRITDNGNGIPQQNFEKIFQPFFTTKPAGQGTGLGLSLAYDIVTKEHGGTIRVESQEKEGTSFIIELPTG